MKRAGWFLFGVAATIACGVVWLSWWLRDWVVQW